jgi:hypothetical protein
MGNTGKSSALPYEKKPAAEHVRWYVIAIGLLLLLVNTYWILMASEVWHSTQLTIASLFFNAVFTLSLLVLINLAVRRLLPTYALSQADLLMIYTMIVMLSTISGHPMMGYLLPAIEHPFWFATQENEWEQLFGNHLPTWLVVRDRDALRGYFQGDSSLYIVKHLKAWLWPVLSWSGFIIVLWTVLMLVSVLLRRQWMENEKLSYPIVQLPLAMTSEPTRFFKSKWMWAGFGIAAAIDIWNGFGFIYPSFPMLQVKNHTVGQFSMRPWNAMGAINISFYPFIIGLMFFTPLDLSFSCWFFYVVGRLQRVLVSAMGFRSVYTYEQSIGAWIALGLIPLWMGRRYFWQMARKVVGFRSTIDDSSEPVRYRTATLGILGGLLLLAFFCVQMGMSWWVLLLYSLVYFPMVLGIARSRAEIGPPVHTLIYVDPGRTLATALGTRRLGISSMAAITLIYPFNRCYRANPLPSQLEGLRMAERARIDSRKLMIGMMAAIVVSVLVTFWVYLHVLYQMGAANKARGWIVYMGRETYNRLHLWLTDPRAPNYSETSGIIGGFMFTVFLMVMKVRFIWWPLHPGGYVLTTGGGLGRSWFAVFVSWAIQSVILRFGGAKRFRQTAPFFLGLILGDYTLGCLWSIIGIALKMPTYGVWH